MSIIDTITLKEILTYRLWMDLILHAYIDIKLFAINVNNRYNNAERDFNLPFMDGSDFARIY